MTEQEYEKYVNRIIECQLNDEPTIYYIYALSKAEDLSFFYVGITSNTGRRLVSHTRKLGYTPILSILQVCTDKDNQHAQCEKQWIVKLRSMGYHLTNKSKGGEKWNGIHKTSNILSKEILEAILL